ncbi:MAG: hypothetical protein DI624_14140 [Brevundimonas sp.]|uniref:hypothetical protein n=1 Tax=Brevundimonas sp. TaxID=1871086 RepID=UPI000DB79800|nr:hypothetical protein [Brevundimonas sp.]PZT95189.1 MAG: hypothetical protein DI624_14140 [Brevundimonas sp.]
MFTPRQIVMAARLIFVAASLGMAILMLGPFQGLEQMFGLDDKAAHAVAFYGVASGLFLIAPRQRRDDLALFVVAAAFAAELLQALTGRSVSIVDFLAGSAGVAAAWAPGRIEQLRHAFRRSPDQMLGEIARADRRLRRRRAAAQAAKRPSLRLVPRD